jgi:hypothetical protein
VFTAGRIGYRPSVDGNRMICPPEPPCFWQESLRIEKRPRTCRIKGHKDVANVFISKTLHYPTVEREYLLNPRPGSANIWDLVVK